jgi:hypothetical protein
MKKILQKTMAIAKRFYAIALALMVITTSLVITSSPGNGQSLRNTRREPSGQP